MMKVVMALIKIIMRSLLGMGRPREDIMFGILKNPIIKDVLNIVYYYWSTIFLRVIRSYSLA
jgi:hypothetical protein